LFFYEAINHKFNYIYKKNIASSFVFLNTFSIKNILCVTDGYVMMCVYILVSLTL
jgi:hypothetical protein